VNNQTGVVDVTATITTFDGRLMNADEKPIRSDLQALNYPHQNSYMLASVDVKDVQINIKTVKYVKRDKITTFKIVNIIPFQTGPCTLSNFAVYFNGHQQTEYAVHLNIKFYQSFISVCLVD